MASFLDGFADSFTSSYNAVTQRRSDKERTALGYEELEERRRASGVEEGLKARGLDIDQGNLDIAKSAEERAQEDAPSIRAGREADTRAALAAAAVNEYLVSPEGLAEKERERKAQIELQGAQTAQARAAAADIAEDTVKKRYENSDAFRAIVEEGMRAEAAANRGAGAKSSAEAAETVQGLNLRNVGQMQELQEQQDMMGTGRQITPDDVYYNQWVRPGAIPPVGWKIGEADPYAESAIPPASSEGSGETPAEEPADPDALDEPAPGENPDEPYTGDGPLQNAPIPAPSAPPPTEPAPAGETVARTPQPRPEPPGTTGATVAPTASPTGRTLDDYERMSDDEFFGLSHEERQTYDRLKAAAGPIDRLTGRRGVSVAPDTAISNPATGEPLSNWNTAGDGALPIDARTPRSRPERPEAALPTGGTEMGDTGGPGTRGLTPGVEKASYTPGEAGTGRVVEAQAGTRNKPLNTKTRSMMETAAAQTGVTVRVTSGAQDSEGPNRTGSHRHDSDVGAGDIQLIDEATGKPVSMKTPEGRAKMIEFMRAARDAGATGFGAGLDYMGDTTIHVGFGDPGVWGAGGKGANAPKWLKDGMNMGAGPSSQPQGTGSRPKGVAQAYQILQQNDMPQMQAAVLAGNIQQESGGDPNAFNQKEGAKGVIQWRMDRLAKLEQFAADNGGDPNSLETQLQFLVQEGESLGSEQDRAAWQEFMSATTPEAANAALKGFIRYGDESANTRLEYANNLLRSGGGEITGEKGSAIPVQGEGGERRRLPTPRGEAGTGGVKRNSIMAGGKEAMKVGMQAAVQRAGFGRGPSAVPDANAQQTQQAFLRGNPSDIKAVNKIHETAQKMLVSDPSSPKKGKLSLAQRNLNSAHRIYQYVLQTQGAEAAQAAMADVYQAYKAMGNQQMAFAKQLTTQGRVDEAVKVAVNAQAYFADGTDATVTKDADGNYIISSKDLETGEITEQQQISADQAAAGIMGWTPIDIEKQFLRSMGRPTTSTAMDVGEAQLQQASEMGTDMPQTDAGDFTRRAIPMVDPLDTSKATPEEQFTDAERDDYEKKRAAINAARTEANKALKPPEPVARELIDTQLERIKSFEADASAQDVGELGYAANLLRDTYGNDLNSIYTEMLQANPTAVAETVVNDLANALLGSNPEGGADRLPMQASRGDYEGMWKLRFVGSPREYNVPSTTATTIRDGIMAKMKGEQELFGRQVLEAGRDAPIIAGEAKSAEEARKYHEGQERYTPGALTPEKAGTKQGALPYGPPIMMMPGYKPALPKYIEASPPQRR